MNFSILNPSHLAYAARLLVGIFLIALFSLPTLARAHSNEYLATVKGAHGGMLRMVEMYHFELVMKDGEAHVWVTDHGDTPQSTKGAIATLRVINGNDAFSVTLKPAGSNELMIRDARIKPRKGTRLVLTVSMKGEASLQTRFSLD
ncbi:hypothetical protein [Thiobacillus sp.]|uniref:hypothetical protein n=1 Tax=Thiobacillus sp. TaxID=924 RepID=UPI00286EB1EC|nr:hypothetical protein [Thiobacillus sp.]